MRYGTKLEGNQCGAVLSFEFLKFINFVKSVFEVWICVSVSNFIRSINISRYCRNYFGNITISILAAVRYL